MQCKLFGSMISSYFYSITAMQNEMSQNYRDRVGTFIKKIMMAPPVENL